MHAVLLEVWVTVLEPSLFERDKNAYRDGPEPLMLLACVFAMLGMGALVLGIGSVVFGGIPLVVGLLPAILLFFVGALLAAITDYLGRSRP